MKAWQDGTTEPSAWTLTASDSSAALQVAAPLAISAALSSATTNLPVTFSWDDLMVKDAPAVPAAPSGLSASAVSNTQINLSWTDNATSEEFYTVERSTDGVTWTVLTSSLPANTISYSSAGLTPN